MNRKYCIITLGVILIASVIVVHARTMAPAPTVEEVADTWIGFTSDGLYYYRLTLTTNGTGLCANTFVGDPAKLYRVAKWTLDEYSIEIILSPVDPDAEPIWMKGTTTGDSLLDLEIGGKNLEWKQKLKLYRETDVFKKHERVKAKMEKAEQPAPQVQSEGTPSD